MRTEAGPFYSPFTDGDGSLPDDEPQAQKPLSTLDSLFLAAGVTSKNPTNPNEYYWHNLDGDGFIGNESFLWDRGNPRLHMVKQMYPDAKRDEVEYSTRWTMDSDSDGLLHIMNLSLINGRDTIEIAVQNHFNPDLSVGVTYDHGFFDDETNFKGFTLPHLPLSTRPGQTFSDDFEMDWMVGLGAPDEPFIDIIRTQVGGQGSLEEIVRFPWALGDGMKWVTRLEGQYDSVFTDSSQPWKEWFKELGVNYHQKGSASPRRK